MGNAPFVIRTSDQRHWYAFVMSVTSVPMAVVASFVAHLAYPMHIIVLSVRVWRKTVTDVQRL